jgi:hypothetical protein
MISPENKVDEQSLEIFRTGVELQTVTLQILRNRYGKAKLF